MDKTKFSQTSPVAQKLREKFEKGELNPYSSTAKPVYENLCAEDASIALIPFKNFSTGFNSIRNAARLNGRFKGQTI